MAVTLDDVRHIAALARLGVTDERATALVGQLNAILGHMDVLAQVDTTGVPPFTGTDRGTPLRVDRGPSQPLARPIATVAPKMEDGFFLVPRLATHEDAGDAS